MQCNFLSTSIAGIHQNIQYIFNISCNDTYKLSSFYEASLRIPYSMKEFESKDLDCMLQFYENKRRINAQQVGFLLSDHLRII